MATVETGDTAGAVSRPKALGLTVRPMDTALAHRLNRRRSARRDRDGG